MRVAFIIQLYKAFRLTESVVIKTFCISLIIYAKSIMGIYLNPQ